MPTQSFSNYYNSNEKVYLGKLWGIPIYVNSEKDRMALVENFKSFLGWEFTNNTGEEFFDYNAAKKDVEKDLYEEE